MAILRRSIFSPRPAPSRLSPDRQVGLFGGPAYTLYKALTALKLARQLTEQGIPAVPRFLAGDRGSRSCGDGSLLALRLNRRPQRVSAHVQGLTGQPVGSLILDSVPLEELKSALAGFPFADEVVERVVAAYQPGRTMGEAFRLLLSGLLGDRGLLFMDPLDPQIREIAAPFLLDAFGRAEELGAAVIARDAELKNLGYHSQVLFESQSSFAVPAS